MGGLLSPVPEMALSSCRFLAKGWKTIFTKNPQRQKRQESKPEGEAWRGGVCVTSTASAFEKLCGAIHLASVGGGLFLVKAAYAFDIVLFECALVGFSGRSGGKHRGFLRFAMIEAKGVTHLMGDGILDINGLAQGKTYRLSIEAKAKIHIVHLDIKAKDLAGGFAEDDACHRDGLAAMSP